MTIKFDLLWLCPYCGTANVKQSKIMTTAEHGSKARPLRAFCKAIVGPCTPPALGTRRPREGRGRTYIRLISKQPKSTYICAMYDSETERGKAYEIAKRINSSYVFYIKANVGDIDIDSTFQHYGVYTGLLGDIAPRWKDGEPLPRAIKRVRKRLGIASPMEAE